MKRIYKLFVIMVILILTVGCISISSQIVENEIELLVKNVTPTGLTLNCSFVNDESKNNVQTDEYYTLDYLQDNTWVRLDTKEEMNFKKVSINIPHEWNIDWNDYYGELSEGTYRITKNIYVNGQNNAEVIYAEFSITSGM